MSHFILFRKGVSLFQFYIYPSVQKLLNKIHDIYVGWTFNPPVITCLAVIWMMHLENNCVAWIASRQCRLQGAFRDQMFNHKLYIAASRCVAYYVLRFATSVWRLLECTCRTITNGVCISTNINWCCFGIYLLDFSKVRFLIRDVLHDRRNWSQILGFKTDKNQLLYIKNLLRVICQTFRHYLLVVSVKIQSYSGVPTVSLMGQVSVMNYVWFKSK